MLGLVNVVDTMLACKARKPGSRPGPGKIPNDERNDLQKMLQGKLTTCGV